MGLEGSVMERWMGESLKGGFVFFLWVVGMVPEGGPMAFEGLECFGGLW